MMAGAPLDVVELVREAVVPPLPAEEARPPAATPDMPALPAAARLAEPDTALFPWLASYTDFSRRWSPRAFEGYHEACALWLLSTVAGRRVAVNLGKRRFTNLYIALAARTTLFAKSTTTEIAIATLRAAGLDWLLAADNATPQKFIHDMTAWLPDDFDSMTGARRERARLRACMAGKRGWWYEEFGGHVSAMMREGGFMADFRGLLRALDDTPERYEYGTIGRGSDVIEQPYLALLANITPADLRPFAARGSALWRDGFLARFALIAPPPGERKRERFPCGERIIPMELIAPLRDWHERLGVPRLEIEELKDGDGRTIGRRVEVLAQEPTTFTPGQEVQDAFYTYDSALLDLIQESENSDLDGNYGRNAEKALRVAALLASQAGASEITMACWAKAQAIAERWRVGLHQLYEQVNAPEPSEERENEERALRIVAKLGTATSTEVHRYVPSLSAQELTYILDGLEHAGELECIGKTHKGTKRYQLARGDES